MEYTLTAIKARLMKISGPYYKQHPKELDATAKKYVKQIAEIKKLPKAVSAVLTVTYPRNKTYGNHSARAVLDVTYANGTTKKITKTASGGGYDMECSAVCAALNAASTQNLIAMKFIPDATMPFPEKRTVIIPQYYGGTGVCDVSNMEHRSRDKHYYGFTVKEIKMSRSMNVLVIKW